MPSHWWHKMDQDIKDTASAVSANVFYKLQQYHLVEGTDGSPILLAYNYSICF
jgi:hypothetical protein